MRIDGVEARAHSGAAALLGAHRSRKAIRYGAWYAAEHGLRTMRSYLTTIITGSVFNPLIYLFALGAGIGSFVDSNSGGLGQGVAYLTFVGPALLSSAALNAAFEECSYPVMGGFKWTRTFWSMNATPIRGGQIASGVLIAASFRIAFTVVAFWAFLFAFGAAPSPASALAVPAALLSGLAFGSAIMAIACRIEEDDSWFVVINRLFIMPMFLFSGTFFPLERYPVALRWIGWLSPLWHGTQLGRVASYGLAEPAWLIAAHIAYLSAILATGIALSRIGFERRLSK